MTLWKRIEDAKERHVKSTRMGTPLVLSFSISEVGEILEAFRKEQLFDEAIEELNILRDKLEAVKTHLTKWKSGHSDWQMGRMSQWKKELVEILEAEGR